MESWNSSLVVMVVVVVVVVVAVVVAAVVRCPTHRDDECSWMRDALLGLQAHNG